MTLHQLTHSAAIEFDFRLGDIARRVVAMLRSIAAARRLDRELAMLDHREIADLAYRR